MDLAKAVRHWLRTSLLLTGSATFASSFASTTLAQQAWQPSRIPANANAAHISQYDATQAGGSQHAWSPSRPATELKVSDRQVSQRQSGQQAQQADGSAHVRFSDAAPSQARQQAASVEAMNESDLPPLRWESPQSASTANFDHHNVNQKTNHQVAKVETSYPNGGSGMRRFTAEQAFASDGRRAEIFENSNAQQHRTSAARVAHAQATYADSARHSQVRPANHQQNLPQDPFGGQLGFPSPGAEEVAPPAAQDLPNNISPQSPQSPGSTLQFDDPPSMSPFGDNDARGEIGDGGLGGANGNGLNSGFGDATDPSFDSGTLPGTTDPMESPEPAALPPGSLEDPSQSDIRTNPFNDERGNSSEGRSGGPEIIPTPREEESANDDELDLPDRDDSSSISCNELRDRIRSRPLNNVSLDVSPSYGEGLRSVKKDTETERLEFAARSVVRDWHDYKGLHLLSGRLVDLKNDRAILDVNGVERTVALMDLSDLDLAYIGDVWNIPLKCGTGNERYDGRAFIPSTVQWKAPGHCHKPLYFEQTQLERYGHDAGPVVQPLLSTAHFFANIAVLPYKAGIHPPNECQYSLGYYRPGNCAPYMVQPIPLSLKGALSQAGFVVGASALIP